ncbi:ankyrin repeat domain-containing protein 16-like [Macrotis lagotis]|uniref:ankyrin repeat domain-containing protein 16-like n=1 Tax=Macrotis lagotis TaxID=92651 RepID=UPI003D69C3A3
MKKCFQFFPKTGRSQSCVSPSLRRDTGPGPRDCKGNKKMGKIHRAAAAGDLWEVLQLLLQGDQGPNDVDECNRTPLHLACVYGCPDVVTLLVERKCHLNPRDLGGLTPLMRAIQGQREQCTSILLKRGADPKLADTCNNTTLHYAAYGQNTAIVSELLHYNCDLEAQNNDGFTPLLPAVQADNKEMVEIFLKNGANVNAVDKHQRTALMIAAKRCLLEMINLIKYDADPFCRDKDGWTIYDFTFYEAMRRHLAEYCALWEKRIQLNRTSESTLGGSTMNKRSSGRNFPRRLYEQPL